MKKVTITIEKVHYEPYPVRDVITAWECDALGIDFLESLKAKTLELKETFDNKQDWAYDVANAQILVNGEDVHGDHWDCMPAWNGIDSFLEALDKEMAGEAEEYLCPCEDAWYN